MHFALIAKRFYMQEDHSIVYYNAFVSTFISSDIFWEQNTNIWQIFIIWLPCVRESYQKLS